MKTEFLNGRLSVEAAKTKNPLLAKSKLSLLIMISSLSKYFPIKDLPSAFKAVNS